MPRLTARELADVAEHWSNSPQKRQIDRPSIVALPQATEFAPNRSKSRQSRPILVGIAPEFAKSAPNWSNSLQSAPRRANHRTSRQMSIVARKLSSETPISFFPNRRRAARMQIRPSISFSRFCLRMQICERFACDPCACDACHDAHVPFRHPLVLSRICFKMVNDCVLFLLFARKRTCVRRMQILLRARPRAEQ